MSEDEKEQRFIAAMQSMADKNSRLREENARLQRENDEYEQGRKAWNRMHVEFEEEVQGLKDRLAEAERTKDTAMSDDGGHSAEDQRDRLVAHVRMLATLMRDMSESAFKTLEEIESGKWREHTRKASRREALKPPDRGDAEVAKVMSERVGVSLEKDE